MVDIYNNTKKTDAIIYQSFNNLVFSDDTRVIHKMIFKINIYNSIINLFGDIVECGVYKGASLALWLQLKKLYEPHSSTKIIGFDFFNYDDTLKDLSGTQRELMSSVLSRNLDELDIESIQTKCDTILEYSTLLIKGDVTIKSKEFSDLNTGLRIKLLYLDLDLGNPTLSVLNNLWDHIVIGGKIIADEYGFHKWDESIGIDSFLLLKKGKYKLENTNIQNPTLIITKLE